MYTYTYTHTLDNLSIKHIYVLWGLHHISVAIYIYIMRGQADLTLGHFRQHVQASPHKEHSQLIPVLLRCAYAAHERLCRAQGEDRAVLTVGIVKMRLHQPSDAVEARELATVQVEIV